MRPRLLHVVISLAPGGLERLVVDWTNARNRRWAGSTEVCCLDEAGELAGEVGQKAEDRWQSTAGDPSASSGLVCRGYKAGEKSGAAVAPAVSAGSGYREGEALTEAPQQSAVHAAGQAQRTQRDAGCGEGVKECGGVGVWECGGVGAGYKAGEKSGVTVAPALCAGSCKHGAKRNDSQVHVLSARRERFPADLAAVMRLRRLLKSGGFTIAHSHNAAAQFYAGLACAGTGIRHVHTEHGSRPPAATAWARMRDRLALRLMDDLVAVSNAAAEGIRTMAGGRQVEVIPNGVAPHRRSSEAERGRWRAELGIPQGARIIGTVGRLAHIKGQDRLMAAFVALTRMPTAGDLRVLIVGDGPERDALKQQAAASGVTDRILFAGFQRDTGPLYELMSWFLLPSRSEGLSVALLEAMAAGVPVMATDVGANREVLEDGKAGMILPEDEGEWPAFLYEALTPEGEAQAKVRARLAADRVEEKYSMNATLERYEAVYGKG